MNYVPIRFEQCYGYSSNKERLVGVLPFVTIVFTIAYEMTKRSEQCTVYLHN